MVFSVFRNFEYAPHWLSIVILFNVFWLQDTHLTEFDQNDLLAVLPTCKRIIPGSKANSQGVEVIIKNNFEYSIKNVTKDNIGNFLLVDLQLSGFSLKIINIHAPNDDNPQFFDKVRKYVEESSESNAIVCGDLNLVLYPKLGSNNYISVNNP